MNGQLTWHCCCKSAGRWIEKFSAKRNRERESEKGDESIKINKIKLGQIFLAKGRSRKSEDKLRSWQRSRLMYQLVDFLDF